MEIKFSYNYTKLKGHSGKARLIEVLVVNRKNLSPQFIHYDTDEIYVLSKQEEHLLLIFEKSPGNIFTTLRVWTPEKEKYYRNTIGKIFSIIQC